MQVAIHNRSILEVPVQHTGVSSVKIYGDGGELVAVVLQHGGAIVVTTADDPKFESFCAQYGIRTKRAETIEV